MKNMDTQHLKAFTTVARLGSFTEAAARLHLTQPAISKRISALEQQLDCRLFDRVNRGISLTPAGQALLPRAEAILESVADTELAITNLTGAVSGTLKLVTSHHIGLHYLPRILKLYTRKYPDVEMDLNFLDSERAYSSIVRGEAELGIITLSPDSQETTESQLLWRDRLSFVVAADHPLASAAKVSLADLSRTTNILPDTGTRTTRLIQSLFAEQGLSLAAGMTTNYLETIKMMVSIGLGWSALPDTILDDSLAVLTIEDAELSRELGYIRHRERTLSNAAQAFIEVMLEKV